MIRIPDSKAFSNLSRADELKRIILAAKKDIANNVGDKEELLVLISETEKELNKIERASVPEINTVPETINEDKIKEILIHSSNDLKTTEIFSNSPPEVEEKNRKEPAPKGSSSWKKIDFSGRTQYKALDIEVSKVKKPWWKFW